jgi:hypothetical protein
LSPSSQQRPYGRFSWGSICHSRPTEVAAHQACGFHATVIEPNHWGNRLASLAPRTPIGREHVTPQPQVLAPIGGPVGAASLRGAGES